MTLRECAGGREADPSFRHAERSRPRRKHFYSWVASDRSQLRRAERLMLKGLRYHQAVIAALNTISTEDITGLDDGRQGAASMACPSATESVQSDPAVSVEPSKSPEKEIVVLVHGFGGGLATWVQNWNSLAQHYSLYALDIPGFARSERRSVLVRTLTDSMDVICGYLNRWFTTIGFRRPVILVGHSFGGFVCAHYAMRAGPQRVRVLAMVDPWGATPALPSQVKEASLPYLAFLRVLHAMKHLSPLRGSGPAGPLLLRWANPRFHKTWEAFLGNPKVIYDYTYHCNALSPAVGEELFKACCRYDVVAKEPLINVLPNTLHKSIGVGFLFGAHSWIDAQDCHHMAQEMSENGYAVRTATLSHAGHHVHTDDSQGFNQTLHALLEELLEVGR